MNSVYDPDYTSGSPADGQPRFHDQAALQYKKYTVLGSKMTVKIIATGLLGPVLFFIYKPKPGTDASIPPDLLDTQEMRTDIARSTLSYSPLSGAIGRKMLTSSYNKNVHFARSDADVKDQRTAFGSNPTDAALQSVGFYNLSDNQNAVQMEVRITYRVMCDSRIYIGQS